MRNLKPGRRGVDPAGEQLLQQLDQLQSSATTPDIEPPRLLDQAVRNMARRELPHRPALPLAGPLAWIAGLATVSVALIALGVSLLQTPYPTPPTSPATPALIDDLRSEAAPASRAEGGLEKARSAESTVAAESAPLAIQHSAAAREPSTAKMDADIDPAAAWLDLIRQLYDQGLHAEAAEQLRAFRADYPDFPLPDWAAELPPGQEGG